MSWVQDCDSAFAAERIIALMKARNQDVIPEGSEWKVGVARNPYTSLGELSSDRVGIYFFDPTAKEVGKWRPEGWKNPFEEEPHYLKKHIEWYESGADLMLEALRKKGLEDGKIGAYGAAAIQNGQPGIYVFIPDD